MVLDICEENIDILEMETSKMSCTREFDVWSGGGRCGIEL